MVTEKNSKLESFMESLRHQLKDLKAKVSSSRVEGNYGVVV